MNIIKSGSVLILTHGCYEAYYENDPVHVMKEFDLDVEMKEFVAKRISDETKFIPFLQDKGLVKPIDNVVKFSTGGYRFGDGWEG